MTEQNVADAQLVLQVLQQVSCGSTEDSIYAILREGVISMISVQTWLLPTAREGTSMIMQHCAISLYRLIYMISIA